MAIIHLTAFNANIQSGYCTAVSSPGGLQGYALLATVPLHPTTTCITVKKKSSCVSKRVAVFWEYVRRRAGLQLRCLPKPAAHDVLQLNCCDIHHYFIMNLFNSETTRTLQQCSPTLMCCNIHAAPPTFMSLTVAPQTGSLATQFYF